MSENIENVVLHATEVRCVVDEGEMCLDLIPIELVALRDDSNANDERYYQRTGVGDGTPLLANAAARNSPWTRKVELRGLSMGPPGHQERDFALFEKWDAESLGRVFFGPFPEPWDCFLIFGDSMTVAGLEGSTLVDCAPEDLERCLLECHARDAEKVFVGGWSEAELAQPDVPTQPRAGPISGGLSRVFQKMFGRLRSAAVVGSRRQAVKKAVAAKKKAGTASKSKKPKAAPKKKGKSKSSKRRARRDSGRSSDDELEDEDLDEEPEEEDEDLDEELPDDEEPEEELLDEELDLEDLVLEDEDVLSDTEDESIEIFEMDESEGEDDSEGDDEEFEDEEPTTVDVRKERIPKETAGCPGRDDVVFKKPAPVARSNRSASKRASSPATCLERLDAAKTLENRVLWLPEALSPFDSNLRPTFRPKRLRAFVPNDDLCSVDFWGSELTDRYRSRPVRPFAVRFRLGIFEPSFLIQSRV